jgi:putative ABC transport system permease protein
VTAATENDDRPTGAPPNGRPIRSLDRKLIRELRDSLGASSAISLVIAAGVAVFVMALSTLAFLDDTRAAYYDRYRLADVFASLSRAPLHVAEEISEIPGVAHVETRVVAEVTLSVPGLDEPASGRLISLRQATQGDAGRSIGLNAIHLVSGRLPDPDAADEVVASEAFFEANRLTLGGTISGILNGRFQEMRIVGVALSPEYVFQIRSGDFLPDDRRFGVLWTSRLSLEAAFDMRGAFNDVSLRLMRGTPTRPVIERLDQILEPFGGIGSYDRTEQLSARFLDDEIKQLRATGLVIPLIFLSVAAFLLNVVLARRIELQREEIATLKAFGYGDGEIAWHYLQFALLISTLGAILGSVIGSWLAYGLCDLYADFYRFPTFAFRPNLKTMLMGSAVSLTGGVVGAWLAVRRVVRLQPAEAMRPPAPARFRKGPIDRFWVRIGMTPLMLTVLRRLRRRPVNTGLSMLGIGFAAAVLLVSNFAVDAVQHMIDFQFSIAQRHDLRVTFQHASEPSSMHELRNIDGILAAEPFRAIPVRLIHGPRQHRTGILGLGGPTGDQRNLYRLLDSDERSVRLPPFGLVLSDKLAELLAVVPGDVIDVEVLEGRRQRAETPVIAIAKEYAGTNAYMNQAALHRLLQEDYRVSGAFMTMDSSKSQSIYDTLQQIPRTAAVTTKSASLDAIRKTIRENQTKMQSINVLFACVIALGVVYNMARITLAEQKRELATLRVIGFTPLEVSFMFMGELMLITTLAIPIGWSVGTGLCYATVKGFESDLYRIPLVISRQNLAFSALVTTLASLTSGLVVRRSLDRLDLIAVLKNHG